MVRTEQVWLKPSDELGTLCHLAKNLYNEGNYMIRQELFTTGRRIGYCEVWNGLFGKSENIPLLPAQTAQQVIKQLDKDWVAFEKADVEWKARPEKFLERPGIPHYKRKDGETVARFTYQQVRLKDGILRFPSKIGLEVRTRLENGTKIVESRIVPQGVGYICEIVYELGKKPELKSVRPERVATIDLGLDNFATMASNIGERPIVVGGGAAKSINQFYNKRRAELQAVYECQGLRSGSASRKLDAKKRRKMKDFIHKATRKVVNWCKEHEIDTVAVGHNVDWKQNINLGRRTNQSFVQVPYGVALDQLRYKLEQEGIRFLDPDEGHTSKCDFLANESIEHHEVYLGKRTSRSWFRSSTGLRVHADVNGALNIGRKAVPEAFSKRMAEGIEDASGLHPVRLNV